MKGSLERVKPSLSIAMVPVKKPIKSRTYMRPEGQQYSVVAAVCQR